MNSFFKIPIIESEEYKAWVRTLPCANCGSAFKSHAHHRIGHGRCAAMKVDDIETMPLCKKCHGLLHNQGWKDWEPKNRMQFQMTTETLVQAMRQEVIVIDKKVAKGIARYA